MPEHQNGYHGDYQGAANEAVLSYSPRRSDEAHIDGAHSAPLRDRTEPASDSWLAAMAVHLVGTLAGVLLAVPVVIAAAALFLRRRTDSFSPLLRIELIRTRASGGAGPAHVPVASDAAHASRREPLPVADAADVPLLPFEAFASTYAERKRQQEEEERERESAILRTVFEQNVELQQRLATTAGVAA